MRGDEVHLVRAAAGVGCAAALLRGDGCAVEAGAVPTLRASARTPGTKAQGGHLAPTFSIWQHTISTGVAVHGDPIDPRHTRTFPHPATDHMPSAPLPHARTTQFSFAAAHVLVLLAYLDRALDFSQAGEFSILFFLPAFLLSALVVAGCVPALATRAGSNAYLVCVCMLSAFCVMAWVSPITMLYAACAIAAAWSARVRGDAGLLKAGAVAALVALAPLVYLCAGLPVDRMLAVSERRAGDFYAADTSPASAAQAQAFWKKAAARGDSVAALRLTPTEAVPPKQIELTPYPPQLAQLPRIELGTAIAMFMPPAGDSLGWDFNANGPISWETVGYEDDPSAGGSRRIGALRIDVLGSVMTVLRQTNHELGWEVAYTTSAPAKFGVNLIRLEAPGCGGYCMFDPRPSMRNAGISFDEVCDRGGSANGVTVLHLTYPGREPMQLRWSNSAGSGAGSSWLEMRMANAEKLTCS